MQRLVFQRGTNNCLGPVVDECNRGYWVELRGIMKLIPYSDVPRYYRLEPPLAIPDGSVPVVSRELAYPNCPNRCSL